MNFNCLLHALVLIQHLVLQQGCHGTQGPPLHGPSLARRYSDVVSGNRYGLLMRTLDGHGVRVDREYEGYLMGREEE